MKIAFSGCRSAFVTPRIAEIVSEEVAPGDEVLVGDCPTGIDLFIREYFKQEGISTTVFVADWDNHGKAAGPIRNGEMTKHADLLIALWDGKSKGTLSAITCATQHGVPVKIYPL